MLKQALQKVQLEIQMALWMELLGYPEAAMVASECLTQTICFVNKFHHFLDRTYSEMLATGFTKANSWLLTCTLGYRVFRYLSEMRTGAQNPVAGDSKALVASRLWATLQMHSGMKTFMEHNFEDHPTLMAEVGQFVLQHSTLTMSNKQDATLNTLTGNVAVLHLDIKGVKRVADHNSSEIKDLKIKVK